MVKNKKLFFYALLTLLAFGLTCSCTKKEETAPTDDISSRIIIGFSQIGAESAWRTCNTASMQQAASDEEIQMIYANAEQKQENQIKAIRSFIVYQVDVIVFVPIVQDGWDNVLQEAKDAGIPVIILDRKLTTTDESLYAGYIGTDSMEEGRNAARFLLKKYEGQPGPFNILELRGTDGSSVVEGRHNGFTEIINTDPRFSIIYSESGDFLRSCGREIALNLVADDLLTPGEPEGQLDIDGKKVDILYSHNDMMTLGALEVLEQNGIDVVNGLTIISIDAQQEAIDALKAGKINCCIECNPKLGPDCMTLVRTVANNYEIPRLVHVPERVFTEFDDLSNLEPRGY